MTCMQMRREIGNLIDGGISNRVKPGVFELSKHVRHRSPIARDQITQRT